MENVRHFWLRAETKPNEQRCAITPNDAAKLIKAGLDVTVEESAQGCFSTEQYAEQGCTIVPTGSWQSAPENAVITAIKELPNSNSPLIHRHIFFGHCYKQQAGSAQLLARFHQGQGALWDWEFLNDKTGKRLIAFGYWAGFAGALIAIRLWLQQHGHNLPNLTPTTKNRAIALFKIAMDDPNLPIPRALIIGALGRCGHGAIDCFNKLGINVTKWDKAETQKSGPYSEILQHEIFLNAVLASPMIGTFIDDTTINNHPDRALSVIVDVSCDPTSPYNPLPIYQSSNSFDKPVQMLEYNGKNIDLSAIDHLPSLLPAESSEYFSQQALPLLLTLAKYPNVDPWQSCYDHFVTACSKL